MESQYPDPELSQIQSTTPIGLHDQIAHTGASVSATSRVERSPQAIASLSAWQNGFFQRSFNPSTNLNQVENDDGQWDRELPAEDAEDLLDENDSDPDYRDHQARIQKLRNDIFQLGDAEDDIDLPSILRGTKVFGRRVRNKVKEPRPRGRQPGQKIGPRKAAELSGDIKLRLATASNLFQSEDTHEAAKVLEEIIRINAEIPAAWTLLAAIYEHDGDFVLALSCLMMAAHVSPRGIAPWLTAASLAEDHKHGPRRAYFLYQAQFCYSGALRADPKNLDCRRARARILEERGKRNGAINEYKGLLALYPTETEALGKIAELCIDHGKCQIAIDAYKESISHFQNVSPEKASLFDWTQVDNYVTLYEVIGHYYKAIAELKSISRWVLGRGDEVFWDAVTATDCEWDVDPSRKIYVLGYAHGKHAASSYELPLELRVKLGRYRLNVEDLDESMYHLSFLDPKDVSGDHKVHDYPHLFQQAADMLFKKDLWERALDFYEPLRGVTDYNNSALLVSIGRCLMQLKKLDLAEQTFRNAISMDDEDVDARMELAQLHEKRNELQSALTLVNEVMVLRRGQKRRQKKAEEDINGEPRKKRRYVRRNPRIDQDVSREATEPKVDAIKLSKNKLDALKQGEELIAQYQLLRSEQTGMRAGDPEATTIWLEAAKALTDDFRSCKAFYPWDKYIKFMGYSGEELLHAATPLDSDLTAIVDRLGKNLGSELRKNNNAGQIPTTYREMPFSEWLNLFLEYAMCLAKNGYAKDSYDICESIEDAVVFYHSKEDKFLTHLCHAVCALLSSDEEACVGQARFFMRDYQFTTDSYRMYNALMRATHSPISWYSSGPSQKFILRQIKCMDISLVDEDRRQRNHAVGERGAYSALDEKGELIINEDMDICLLMIYGQILYIGQSYAYALNYFLRCYALDPNNAMIHLCIGLSYTHHAMKRQCENRQHHILQGTTFIMRYYEARKVSPHREERMEAHYNVARSYHMLGMVHLAVRYYEEVLKEAADEEREREREGEVEEVMEGVEGVDGGEVVDGGSKKGKGKERRAYREDLQYDAAYNLQGIYTIAGNMDLARAITRRWLVL